MTHACRVSLDALVAGVRSGRWSGIVEDGLPEVALLGVELDGVAPSRWLRWSDPSVLHALAQCRTPVIGLAATALPAQAAPVLEALTCTVAPGGPGRAWVEGDPATSWEQLAQAAVQAPLATLTLAGLLRITAQLPVPDALVAESFAYAMLLGGPEHARWLATRSARPPVVGDVPVVVRRLGDDLFVELDRPARHNAFGAAVRDGLVDALELAAADPTLRVVLSGRGPSFCSGGDLDEFGSLPGIAQSHAVRSARSAALALHRVRDRTVVRVHGAVVGAGVEVASFADRVVAEESAWFRLPELDLGLVPGAGGTVGVPRRIGRWRTAWMVLTGARVEVPTALRWGLVDEVVRRR